MRLRSVLLIVYMLISVLLFMTFNASLLVWLSFFLNALILLGITIYHLFIEKEYSPFLSSFIVFTFLFFLVAPIVQIDSFANLTGTKFSNFFPYNKELTLYTNILISVFNILFFYSYIIFKSKKLRQKYDFKITRNTTLPLTILSVFIFSLIIFIISYDFTINEIATPNWKENNVSVMVLLLWKKVLFLVPFGGILLCYQYFNKVNKKQANYFIVSVLFLLFLILLLWFKNPLTEKRNALGPVYICLLFLFVPRLINTNIKMLSFLFFAMVIVFPLTAIFTHTDATYIEIYNNPFILITEMKEGGIFEIFNTLHYDAFSNIMVSIDYVYKYGYSLGYQLLSAFLFFIPRSIWSTKPNSSGKLIGEHLIDKYDFNFSNLSNPLVSEGYINFGIFGVIFGAILLAYVIVVMMGWLKSNNNLKKIMSLYFAIHLIFLLRGDFTNGFTYYIGALIGVIVIPKTIEYLIQQLILLKKNDNI